MKSAGKARNNGLYRHIRTSKEIIRNLLNDYYNKTNYELAYTIERVGEELVVVVMAGTRENFYDQLKRYIKG